MSSTYVCMVKVCACCLQDAAYAEPCGCDEHGTLCKLAEGDYLTLGNGMSTYSAWSDCAGCGLVGGELFPMGYWRTTA